MNTLIHYIRYKNKKRRGKGRGVIVAVSDTQSKFKVGWSAVCPKDSFDKELGLKIATERCNTPTKKSIPHDMAPYLVNMQQRAQKYFK